MLKASELLDIMCIEKEAGLMDTVKETIKSGAGKAGRTVVDTAHDVAKATGIEKFKPKHDIGTKALTGAVAGAGLGAAGGVATNSGEDKDNFGAAIKGGVLGAVTGGIAGGTGAHILNKKDAKAFKDSTDAFRRGAAVGAAGTVVGKMAKDKAPEVVNAVKNVTPDVVKDGVSNLVSDIKGKAGKYVDSVVEKAKKVNDEWGGHVR